MDEIKCACGTPFKPKNGRHVHCNPDCAHIAKVANDRKRYTIHLKAVDRQPVPKEVFVPRADDFTQAIWEKEQKALTEPNGWKCDLCGADLEGPDRYWCSDHKSHMERYAEIFRVDGYYGGGGDKSHRAFQGVI